MLVCPRHTSLLVSGGVSGFKMDGGFHGIRLFLFSSHFGHWRRWRSLGVADTINAWSDSRHHEVLPPRVHGLLSKLFLLLSLILIYSTHHVSIGCRQNSCLLSLYYQKNSKKNKKRKKCPNQLVPQLYNHHSVPLTSIISILYLYACMFMYSYVRLFTVRAFGCARHHNGAYQQSTL
ncbi:hypothetical protein F5884DRAFT_778697 [Xylogone sp. PMI_703]|nr:hypothetical protein F5884DRAFT_778697 [Xylogone sp. PMI_703]